jgi:hypothetical protein
MAKKKTVHKANTAITLDPTVLDAGKKKAHKLILSFSGYVEELIKSDTEKKFKKI